MKLKLNGVKHKVTIADNLTVQQYINLSKYESIGLIEYLQATTGLEFSAVAGAKLTRIQSRKIKTYIGEVVKFEQLNELASSKSIFEFEGFKYKLKDFEIDTVGVRSMYEARTATTQNHIELSVYVMAILLQKEYDAEEVQAIYENLLISNYLDTLPFALFFFRKFQNIQSGGRRLLRTFLQTMFLSFRSK